jgi:hypothetical protein
LDKVADLTIDPNTSYEQQLLDRIVSLTIEVSNLRISYMLVRQQIQDLQIQHETAAIKASNHFKK